MNYICAIYVRVSREDENIDNMSKSIENQIKILTDYACQNQIEIYKVYIDDGVSGECYLRQGLDNLINDMREEKFNTLIMKDLSRLGRKMYKVGEFIDKIFPLYNIRVIAVDDFYDSINNVDERKIQIKNLLNDYYLKEFKRKNRASLRYRANNKHMNYYPKYGYKFNDKKEEIDEYSSKVVKKIFNMYSSGFGTTYIASFLNKNNILTRSRYAVEVLKMKPLNKEPAREWKGCYIWEILNDYEYCGHSVNLIKNENPIIIKNTHYAVISEEEYFLAHNRMKNKKCYGKNKNISLSSILMDLKSNKCLTFLKNRTYYNKNCKYSLSVEKLHNMICKDFIDIVKEYLSQKEKVANIYKKVFFSLYNYDKNGLDMKIYECKKKCKRLFEDFVLGKLNQNEYYLENNKCIDEMKNLEKQLNQNENIIYKLNPFKKHIVNIINKHFNKEEQFVSFIKKVVSKIVVDKVGEEFNIGVFYKFKLG